MLNSSTINHDHDYCFQAPVKYVGAEQSETSSGWNFTSVFQSVWLLNIWDLFGLVEVTHRMYHGFYVRNDNKFGFFLADDILALMLFCFFNVLMCVHESLIC